MPTSLKYELPPLTLLSAGKSTRMGTPKGLLDYAGQPWLLRQLRSFAQAGGKRATIVLGYHCDQYNKQMPWLLDAFETWYEIENLQVSVVINQIPYLGSFFSLQTALRWLIAQNVTATFVQPVDVPVPGRQVFEDLVQQIQDKNIPLASIPSYANKKGHPVLITEPFMKTLLNANPLEENARLDYQLRILEAEQVRFAPVKDAAIVYNFNTPQDWQNYNKESRKTGEKGVLLNS